MKKNILLLIGFFLFFVLGFFYYSSVVESYERNQRNNELEKNTTIIVKTLLRPLCLDRLIKSIRKFYKNIPIVVVDDSPDISNVIKKEDGLYLNNILYKKLPFDSGVSRGRNAAVQDVKTKYVLLVDDDFVFTDKTNINLFYDFLEKNREYSVICGAVDDRDLYSGVFYNTPSGIDIRSTKDGPPTGGQSHDDNFEGVIDTERGLNFFLTTKETLLEVPWDENLKIEEHSEHFYRFKLHQKKIGILRDVVVHHDGGKECDKMDGVKDSIYKSFRKRTFKNFIFLKYSIQEFCGQSMTEKQKKFHAALSSANQLLQGIPFVITCGTALGFYREGGFIEWDNDIDLFLDEFYKSDDIIKRMSAEFDLVREFPTEFTFKHRDTDTMLDIFFTKSMKTANGFRGLHLKENLQYSVYVGKAGKLDEVKFKLPQYVPEKIMIFGREYNIIPKGILSYIYGETWGIPKEYSFADYMKEPSGILYLDDAPVPLVDADFFNTFFGDNIYVINMANRPDKMEKVSKELNKLNIKFQRFEGIKGQKLCAKLSAGEVGCAESHQGVWKKGYNEGGEWVLVIEDDIVIPDGIEIEDFGYAMLEAVTGNNPAEIIYFGHCFSKGVLRPSFYPSAQIFLKNAHASCTHFYAVKRSFIERMLPMVKNNNNCKEAVDTTIDKYYENHRGSVCVFSKRKYKDKPEYYGEGLVLQLRDKPSDVTDRSSDKSRGRA